VLDLVAQVKTFNLVKIYKQLTQKHKGKSMKKLLAVLLLVPGLVLAQKAPQGVMYDAQIVRVNDGDTVVIAAPFLPAPLKPELAVRVYGVDTPEKGHRAQCPSEAQRGEQASAFTKNAVAKSVKRQVVLYGWDKFGGRVLGDMILDGQSLRAMLIANGFAREYYGDAKQSWCN
jgi:endonuclease YncB( thermonuclease family)